MGAAALLLLGTLLGVSLWVDQSQFAPVVRGETVDYVFCSASPGLLLADVAGAILGLFLIHFIVRWWLSEGLRVWSPPTSREAARFAPLALCGLNLAGLLTLWPPFRDWWTPITYVAVDAHALVSLAAAAVCIAGIRDAARQTRATVAARPIADPLTHSFAAKTALAAAVIGIAVAASPHVRFSSLLIGDEPKYVRYCENWWQGRGMDVAHVENASDRPRGESPRLFDNLRSLGPELRRTAADLMADAPYLTRWDHPFNRAVYIGNWFVQGKNQGVYQMHNPGISLVMLPAYVVDRALFNLGTGRFADDLFTVNLTFLLIYGLLAVAIVRMLLAGGPRDQGLRLPFVVAGASALSLPLSAFAFQFYPDTTAGLIVCLACATLLAIAEEPTMRRASAFALGCALGFLPWLGVRFGPASLILTCWLAWTSRRRGGWCVVAGWLALLAPLGLYMYHVTGSLLPNALHGARDMFQEFRWHWVPGGLLGLMFDREYGLLALAPVYLLALPGLGVMMRQGHRAIPILLTIGLSVAIPAAGHGYWNVGTTPLRHVLAVIPLLTVPVVAWLLAVRRRPLLMAASVAVVLASMQMALDYDLAMEKTTSTMVDASVSGWNPSLLFPVVRRAGWPLATFDGGALIFWVLASVAAVIGGARLATETAAAGLERTAPRSRTGLITASLLVGAAGMVAIAAGAPARDLRFLPTGSSGERPLAMPSGPCWIHLGNPRP